VQQWHITSICQENQKRAQVFLPYDTVVLGRAAASLANLYQGDHQRFISSKWEQNVVSKRRYPIPHRSSVISHKKGIPGNVPLNA
jgi:hypothetical protein